MIHTKKSAMNVQTQRDNAAKFCKDNPSLNVIKVRAWNDVQPEAIHIRATETITIAENLRKMKTMSKKSWKILTKSKMKKL